MPARLVSSMLLLAGSAPAATIRVPADQPTIQAGVDAAVPGDTILIAPGTYPEAVRIIGKTDLTIEGSGLEVTRIRAPFDGPAINAESASGLVITGLRLSSDNFGGDSPSIAGIRLLDCRPATVKKVMVNRHSGNAVVLYRSDVTIFNCLFVDNGDDGIRVEDAGFGGPASVRAWHNTIAHNTNGSGCGIWVARPDHDIVLFDNIFWNNDYSIAPNSGVNIVHDYNVVGGTGTHFYGSSARAANEPGCDPLFVSPGLVDFHIQAGCADDAGIDTYAGILAASDDFENQPRPAGAGFDIGADELLTGCSVSMAAPPAGETICAGSSARLDASSASSFGCASGLVWEWSDGAGGSWSSPAIDVMPTVDTTYTVRVSCMTDPGCATTVPVTVTVHEPPKAVNVTAADLAPCTTGIEVAWDAATFHDATRSGVYNVYRSETSCADAVTRPPVVQGLTSLSWIDPGTVPGRTYVYVVEAEDARTSTPCASGPHGGAISRSCALPAIESPEAVPPDGVYACLRARHDDHQVTMLWPSARGLLSGEHFHLLHALDLPTNPFVSVNSEADLSRSFTHEDRRSWIQFFDLRVANPCEIESEDEYPPGWDR